MKFTVDTKQYFKRSAKYKNMGNTMLFLLTNWGSKTVERVKKDTRFIFKARKGRTSQIVRNVSFRAKFLNNISLLTIGTGLGPPDSKEVVYSRIQEKGGMTHPTVTKKMRGWAWRMFYETDDSKYKAIALTKKGKLDVKVPASHWLSTGINYMEPMLYRMLSPEEILRVMDKGV